MPALRTIGHGTTIVDVDHGREDLNHGSPEGKVALGDLVAAVDLFCLIIRIDGVAPCILVLLDTLHENVKHNLVSATWSGNAGQIHVFNHVEQMFW